MSIQRLYERKSLVAVNHNYNPHYDSHVKKNSSNIAYGDSKCFISIVISDSFF